MNKKGNCSQTLNSRQCGVPGLGSSREGEHTHQPDDSAPLCLQAIFTLQLQAEEPMNILAESELRTRVSW